MGILNPAAPLRAERFRRSWSIASLSADERATIPLMLAAMPGGGYRSRDNLHTCLCEIRDARGTVLLRKQVVEIFRQDWCNGSSTGWVMNELEADRFLRDSAGVNNTHTITELPPLIEPYAEINALWVSDEASRGAALTQAMLRRLLLMGIWIYGRDATIFKLTAMAGLPGQCSVLLGGIQGVLLPSVKDSGEKHGSSQRENSFWDYYIPNAGDGNKQAVPVMENRRDLFQPLKGRYLGWTCGVLGIFLGVACIGLPVAFRRLKGSRRLMLWWLIPLVTVSIGSLSLIGGQLLLPRQPQADVTEYRFAFAGWPEVFCRSVNRSLTFENRQVSWTMPLDSFIMPVRSRSSSVGQEWMEASAGGMVHGMSGVKRGQLMDSETAGFRALPLPVASDDSTTNPPGLRVLAPLRQVHVWENGAWHRAGDLKAGQIIRTPFGSKTNTLFGLPQCINDSIPVNGCPSAPFYNTLIVAALSDEPAAVQPGMKNTRSESRVVWLIQIPVQPTPPVPGEMGDKPR